MTQEEFGKACIGLGCLFIVLPFVIFVSIPLLVIGVAMIAAAFGG
jgi:hypothetical protein